MSVDIQNTNIRAPLDVLDPAPPNTNLPRLDERTIVWTLPIRQEFVAQRPKLLSFNGIDLNGATASIGDTDTPTVQAPVAGVDDVTDNMQRIWNVHCQLANGTVNPIRIQVSMGAPTIATFPMATASVANPGSVRFGPVYIPNGFGIRVTTLDNGGAGDTLDVDMIGFLAIAGAPLPIFPLTFGEH
tara:strand:- start:336 stop:893 length:558 start_codon:yes stop_codon:yes gene_type:complete